jgi:hypothetical protein
MASDPSSDRAVKSHYANAFRDLERIANRRERRGAVRCGVCGSITAERQEQPLLFRRSPYIADVPPPPESKVVKLAQRAGAD